MTTTRINITLPNDMHKALAKESSKSGASMANLTRMALADWLALRGYDVEYVVSWGGDRVTTNNTAP
jgi:hypothetical protein